jgi:hypothetical protein
MYDEGSITITANPMGVHNYWVNLPGATNPMLIANGAANSTLNIWAQDVSVVTGTNYNFSASVMNVCCNLSFGGPNSPSSILFQISSDGGANWTTIASRLTDPTTDIGVLENVTGSYLATTTGAVTLRAINDINVASGNDFALDNLSFASAVPEPGTWAMLFLGFGAIGLMMRRRQRGMIAA